MSKCTAVGGCFCKGFRGVVRGIGHSKSPLGQLVFCSQYLRKSYTPHGFSFFRSKNAFQKRVPKTRSKNTFPRFSTLLRPISRHSSNRNTCNSGRAGHTPYAASHQLSLGISTHSPRRTRVFGQSAGCEHLPDPRTKPSRRSRQRRQLQA